MARVIDRFVAGLGLLVFAATASAIAQTDQGTSARGPLPGVAATPTAPPITVSPPIVVSPPVVVSPSMAAPSKPVTPISRLARLYIAGLQRALPSHGYHPGPETGHLDHATAAAIRAYQRDAGLPEDPRGEMNLKTTLDSVNFARPPVMATPSP